MGANDALQMEPVIYKSNLAKEPVSRIPKNLESRRNDPQYDFYFRSERVFSVGHQWYFSTREEVDFGPFKNKASAQEALRTFLMLVA